MGLLRNAITRARGSNPFDFRNRELLDALQREPAAPILPPIAPSLPPTIPFFPRVPLPAPVLPPSIPDPTPLERLPIITPRDEQIFVPPRTIIDRELPREILPPVTPPVIPPQPPVAPPSVKENPFSTAMENPFQKIDDPIPQSIIDQFQGVAGKPNPFVTPPQPPVAPPVAPFVPSPIASPPINIGGPPLDTSLIPQREILQRPIIPPRRDDFMSIEQIGNTTDPVIDPIQPVITLDTVPPAPTTPAAVATDVGADPVTTIPQDVRGQVDPVLAQQDTRELQTDPLLRALYFGTADQPGFINQLQQATANLIGSDVPLQGTAGLSNLEQMAQERALADLGVAEPFVEESADLIRGSTRQFDPNMTQQFFNPFENQVVQQTIKDVLEAGEKRDVAQRARDVQTGGLSAFGSRARLSAADRQEALGRGLAEALGGIRQAGFGQAQRDALTTFAQQRQAEQLAARDIGQVGSTLADLRARERAGLVGFGQTGRDIEETALSRLFQQQVDAQGRPLQALQVAGGLLPQFQAGSTQIDSQYRLPSDPSALGLGAAFGAYTSLKPPGTQTG